MLDPDIIASRATEPSYYEAPWPYSGEFEPSPYQHAAVEYRIARRHGIIGDAPGVGKTCEAILFSNSIGAKYNLVVCPASLRLNWEREVHMWSSTEGVSTYTVLKSKDGVSEQHNYVIISYNLLNNPHIFEALMAVEWDHLILDEAHALKDPKGNRRTKAICGWVDHGQYIEGLADVSQRITLLTGTLLPNQPIECYNAIRLCNWEAIDCMSLEDFREEYYEEGGGWITGPVLMTKDKNGFELDNPFWVNKPHWSNEVRNQPRNLDDLQYRLRKYVMVRRQKEDVLDQLPDKQWHPFPLETTTAIRQALKHPGWEKAKKLYELDPTTFDKNIPIDGDVSTALRQLGEAKATQVAEYVADLLESGVEKVVVGAWHRTTEGDGVAKTGKSVLHYLRDKLSKFGLVYMDGTTSSVQKQKAVDEFQNLSEVRVMLGQLVPLGEGWTLAKAQDVVFAEFYWVPGKNDQLLDRVHRRGQEADYVLGHIPLVPGSMDERVMGTAISKDINIHHALDKQ